MTEPPQEWIEVQDALKRRLILEDDFAFVIDPNQPNSSNRERLRYVGGVDLSFLKEDPCVACGALVVIDLENNLLVVYEDFAVVRLDVPYIPGFLAFREAPVLLELLEKMKRQAHPFYPQLLMVDGNGLLHPRGFGLACHLGVLADLPTIGVGKNLHHVDGLTQSGMRQLLEASENCAKDLFFLTGNSECTWGVALRSTPGSSKPIFISTGNRISLESSIKIVKMCCKYRVPESIRRADISSRAYLKNLEGFLMQHASNEPDNGTT